jgi:hypothetical protein
MICVCQVPVENLVVVVAVAAVVGGHPGYPMCCALYPILVQDLQMLLEEVVEALQGGDFLSLPKKESSCEF